jgi:hypothetical protein
MRALYGGGGRDFQFSIANLRLKVRIWEEIEKKSQTTKDTKGHKGGTRDEGAILNGDMLEITRERSTCAWPILARRSR